jgi:hypothetical protein
LSLQSKKHTRGLISFTEVAEDTGYTVLYFLEKKGDRDDERESISIKIPLELEQSVETLRMKPGKKEVNTKLETNLRQPG